MLADLKFAFRQLTKFPGFTLIAVVTLALGIGVNTSMFSVLNELIFHTPAYPEPDRLVRVYRTGPSMQTGPHSPANFLDYQARVKSFGSLAAFTREGGNYTEVGKPAERLSLLAVSGDFFGVLGVPPLLGRSLTVEDDATGRETVVVLSEPFWRQRFAGDPAVIGRSLRLDGQTVTVVGVMPARCSDPLVWGAVSAWRPHGFTAETRLNRGGNWLNVVARLAHGIRPEQARAEMNALSAELAAAFPDTNAQTAISLVPFFRSMQDKAARTLSLFAMGLASCVLLIACANLANLLFARNVVRAREHAIRAALGATRLRLVRQALAESLVIALAGGTLGLLVASWGNALLATRLFVGGQLLPLALDWRVAGFAFAAAALSTVLFGLLPALLASRTDLNDALKQGTRTAASHGNHRVRHGLIVVEVALALVLLSSAGFFLRGLEQFLHRDHGWQTDHLLAASLNLPDAKYPDDPAQAAFYERLEARLATLPGVTHVSLSRTLPFYGFGFSQRFLVEGRLAPERGAEPMRDVNGITPSYFATMGIELLEGRSFTPADATGPMRTVISESMARQLWPGESALGKRIAHPVQKEWQEIIGVVRDVSFASNLDSAGARFQTYRLLAREPSDGISLALRCTVPPETLADTLRAAIAELDVELPVNEIRPVRQAIEQNTAGYALTGSLLTAFAILGLLLAGVGLYGVISGFAAQRTGEIGIRMALGAQIADVLQLVLGQGLRLVLLGIVIGLAGAGAVAKLLPSVIPALPPAEPLIAAGTALLLLATALLACWLPARRATQVDPLTALRAE